jgi:hypothetical protein
MTQWFNDLCNDSRKCLNHAYPYHAVAKVPFLLSVLRLVWTDFLLRLIFRYNGAARNQTRSIHAGPCSHRR